MRTSRCLNLSATDEDDDSVIETEPAQLSPPSQLNVFSSLYPLPPVSSSESTWNNYSSFHSHTINRHFRNWLTHQRNNYRWSQLPGGPVMYDSRLSESENEAIWQSDNSMRIKHSMTEFFQPDDYRIATLPRVLPVRVGAQTLLRCNI